ncbi:hypothetical protein BP6252_07978 [Coleophoma cylindrospora]|uniref:TauD/TfdA-like domain-containing protein n=1 Tax=Coleophoma cylindrospora TaxID=1849047 RepID=A0A3D8RBM0_9HELO|nr:hypothetical protein BP6252_07978 [Coleophoma cylindrospora]
MLPVGNSARMSRPILNLPSRLRRSYALLSQLQARGLASVSGAATTQVGNQPTLLPQDIIVPRSRKADDSEAGASFPKLSNGQLKRQKKKSAKHHIIEAQTISAVKAIAENYPEAIQLSKTRIYSPAFLRDVCSCSQCVDPSTQQKNFQTSDIPLLIKARGIEQLHDTQWRVKWENDVDGYGEDHVTTIDSSMLDRLELDRSREDPLLVQKFVDQAWDKSSITKDLQFFDFHDYMENDKTLLRALLQLRSRGLLLLRNVPESETSVEDIAGRIGNIRDTLYGRTWDVKSVASAKNVAYTSKNLGLHMDLLYVDNTPGLQLLHCLKNSCAGGRSIFSDALQAAGSLLGNKFTRLARRPIPYHYFNDGQDYYKEKYLLARSDGKAARNFDELKFINWSPPFQGLFRYIPPSIPEDVRIFNDFLDALKSFSQHLEAETNVLDYLLQEGECVVFNNRRVVHGRREFDTSSGERWLKGTYVDTEVFESRLRVLAREHSNLTVDDISAAAQYVLRGTTQ